MAKPVTPRIERICEECQAKFIVKLGDFGRKYCSTKCYRKKLGRQVVRELAVKQRIGS